MQLSPRYDGPPVSALPLMISWGVGSELRQPLGITMVGGLIVSQMLTLFTTPVVYLSMFDPKGGAVIPKNIAAMPAIPFLWVVGTFDPIQSRGKDYAFTRARPHPPAVRGSPRPPSRLLRQRPSPICVA